MSISQEELHKIAQKLSKLPGDNPALLGNISDILTYVKLLDEVDTQGVAGTVSVVGNSASLREDTLKQFLANPDELLDCSPQKIAGRNIVLPNIMK